MSAEIFIPYQLEPEYIGDCLDDSFGVIINALSQKHRLNIALFSSLKEKIADDNDFIVNLFDLFSQYSFAVPRHNFIAVIRRKKEIFNALWSALEDHAICEVTVRAKPWIQSVLKLEDDDIKPNDFHSIVITGYYQPIDNKSWFYVFDPYEDQVVFPSNDQLFDSMDQLGAYAGIDLFGLSAGGVKLFAKFDESNACRDTQIKRKILSYLPGKSPKEKLAHLLPRKSARE